VGCVSCRVCCNAASKALPNGHAPAANGTNSQDNEEEGPDTDMPALVDSESNKEDAPATAAAITAADWGKARELVGKLLSDGIALLELSVSVVMILS
jgi:hypothetical protein